MNEKSEIKVGKSAVLTHKDGGMQSVKITRLTEDGVTVRWKTGLTSFAFDFVPRAEFSRLQMFPDDCKFMAI